MCLLSFILNTPYIFLEEQLAKSKTEKDLVIIFIEEILQKNRDRRVFKKVLKSVGKNYLAVKLERPIFTGKS